MSYSFPSTYSSGATNYYNTFELFRSLFKENNTGQLKFFKDFVSNLFEDDILNCKTKINTYNSSHSKKNRDIIISLCSNTIYHDNGMVAEIKYIDLLDFMINLRNRYFHFISDRKDVISNIDFNGELFFESLNDTLTNWLSMIYFEILYNSIYKVVRKT